MDCPLQSFDVRVDMSDDGVLLVRGLDAFELGAVGAAIWQRCDGHTPIRDISRAITAEFDVEEEIAAADVVQLIKDLRSAGLVE